MGLLDFLINDDNKKEKNDAEFERRCKELGLSDDEIKDAKASGISPEEWLEENEPEDYYNQELDKD